MRHLTELTAAAESQALEQLNLLVWAKTNAGMGSFYRSAHEMIGVLEHGHAAHINNVELGHHGRNRTNVIHMPGVNTFGKGRAKALELHPTVKPVGLIADLILDGSRPGETILDSRAGSGTTLIAAEKTDGEAEWYARRTLCPKRVLSKRWSRAWPKKRRGDRQISRRWTGERTSNARWARSTSALGAEGCGSWVIGSADWCRARVGRDSRSPGEVICLLPRHHTGARTA